MQESNNITNANQTLRNIAGKKSIITKSYAGNEGKIVTCIRLATEEEVRAECMDWDDSPVWVVDSSLNGVYVDTGDSVRSSPYSWDNRMTPLQDLDEPEQQVQELYAPSPKTKKVVDKSRMYNYTPDF